MVGSFTYHRGFNGSGAYHPECRGEGGVQGHKCKFGWDFNGGNISDTETAFKSAVGPCFCPVGRCWDPNWWFWHLGQSSRRWNGKGFPPNPDSSGLYRDQSYPRAGTKWQVESALSTRTTLAIRATAVDRCHDEIKLAGLGLDYCIFETLTDKNGGRIKRLGAEILDTIYCFATMPLLMLTLLVWSDENRPRRSGKLKLR